MNKEQFIEYYFEGSEELKEEMLSEMIAMPCKCHDPECKGWAMVNNNELSINAHIDLYM